MESIHVVYVEKDLVGIQFSVKVVMHGFIRSVTCLGLACPIDGKPVKHVSLRDKKLDALESFLYLGDRISPNGGREVSTITRICFAWGKFCELLPLLKNLAIPLKRRGKVYNSCICTVMLHDSECWF